MNSFLLLPDLRSLAIDWLCTQGNTPVYVYFQRELRSEQTPAHILQSLVGQLLVADISNPPDTALLEFFEKAMQQSQSATLDFSDIFTSTCTRFSNLFGKVVVLLDAFDECDPSHQATIGDLIATFNACGIQIYITTRPHNMLFLPENDTRYLKIAAKDEDVQNYIRQEIKRRKIKLDPEVEESIVTKIGEGIEGM